MLAVFGLVFFAAPVVLVVGLVWPKPFRGRKNAVVGALALGAVGFVGIGLTAPKPDAEASRAVPSATDQRIAAPAPATATSDLDPRQARFIEVVTAASEAWRTASNDMMRGGIRTQRADDMCQILRPLGVEGWVGTIASRSSRNDGRGILVIRMAPNISVGTGSSDAATIPANSPLFARVAAFERGERVIFSGAFQRGGNDCVSEASLTVRGAMVEPEFRFIFTDVRAAP